MKPLSNALGATDCFFCGRDNPQGLKLTFFKTETEPFEVVCRWTPAEYHTGYKNVLHGGIQCGLIDEIMGWAAVHLTGEVGVTSDLEFKFLRPLRVSRELEARARIAGRDGARLTLAAEIRDDQGRVCTTSRGVYHLLTQERFEKIVSPD